MIRFNVFKDGKRDALTMSYDDGRMADERLVEIFNKHGIKGSFHLNSGSVLDEGSIGSKYPDLSIYEGHEVSCHGKHHLSMDHLSGISLCNEIIEDRKILEKLAGYPVCGMSYANGRFSDKAIDVLKACGIVYSRTIKKAESFKVPEDFMKWNPTCHHRECLEYADKFINTINAHRSGPRILYVWGHSFEFNNENNWDLIEEFCKKVGGRDDIWYATNMEIYRYITAQRSLVVSADETMVYNPSSEKVWISAGREVVCVNPGETLKNL